MKDHSLETNTAASFGAKYRFHRYHDSAKFIQ